MKLQPKPIRVLVLEYWPRAEFRFLIGALRKDPEVSFHGFLASADEGWEQPASEGLTPLTHLGSVLENPKALSEYDVLVWGSLSLSRAVGYAGRDKLADRVKAFVRKGGGILFIAGADYLGMLGPGRPLEAIMPVSAKPLELKGTDPTVVRLIEQLGHIDPARVQEAINGLRDFGSRAWPDLARISRSAPDENIRKLTAQFVEEIPFKTIPVEPSKIRRSWAGEVHAALRATDHDLWGRAPTLRWWLAPLSPASAAQVLVETEAGDPILAVREVERGRTAFLATDDWWLWRFQRGDADYYPMYRSLLRWLARR